MACNVTPSASQGLCTVQAGQQVTVEMHAQPGDRNCAIDAIGGNHDGPVLIYLAKVDNALTADGASAKWFKIAELGYISSDYWGTDYLNANCGKLTVTIPSCIPAGQYLLRAEVIALHVAFQTNGAQFYMSCFTINVTGGGSASPSTVSIPGAYSATDPGKPSPNRVSDARLNSPNASTSIYTADSRLIRSLGPLSLPAGPHLGPPQAQRPLQAPLRPGPRQALLRLEPLQALLRLELLQVPLHLEPLQALPRPGLHRAAALAPPLKAVAKCYMDNAEDKVGPDRRLVPKVHAPIPTPITVNACRSIVSHWQRNKHVFHRFLMNRIVINLQSPFICEEVTKN
ncbi:hypothetical protein FRC14_004147 [Serendipita sp. 396]|nr:hypothetical protein FRC14_004147 [Serendipita sp. 396]